MAVLIQNLRYGLRMLAKSPGFTAAAVLCLALGIGATTAIFSVVNSVLLRPLRYAHSERLVRIFTEFPTFPNGGLRHFWVSPPEYFDLKRDAVSFDAVEAWANQGVNLAGAEDPVRATASAVTGGMMGMLGVTPQLGRLLSAQDDRPGVPRTAILSHGLWQRAFGGDPGILGRDIRVNGSPCTVIGVMPPSFAFPPGEQDPPELWMPLQLDPAKPGGRGSHFLSVLGRMRGEITFAQASGELGRHTQRSRELIGHGKHAWDPKFHPLLLVGFQDEVVRNVRPAMLVLMGAVGFVLLIACVNVANLLLARAEARRREIAVRAAIGAGIVKLLQQFVTEGILLSLAGAAFGMLFAFGGLRLLVATNAGSIPRIGEIQLDWTVMLFALALALATGVIFGLAPVLHVRPGRLHDILKSAGRGPTGGGVSAGRFRSGLVISELALALVLLIGAGLMVKAFWRLQNVDAGFDGSGVLTMRIALPPASYGDPASTNGFWNSLLDRVQAVPGVVSAGIATGLPPARPINANDTKIEGFVYVPGGPLENIDYWNFVSPEYFETLKARLLEGRLLTAGDDSPAAPPVVVINQAMARAYWPRESALGHRIRTDNTPGERWRTIVGVVADMKNGALDRPAGTELYLPHQQASTDPADKDSFIRNAYLLIRTAGNPMGVLGAVRESVRALDRSLPISSVLTMEDVMAKVRSRPRFVTLLLTLFSSVSMILAALGVYGVISYSVAQRTGEIGIRVALGAQNGDVLRLIGGGGLRLAVAGTALGSIGALLLTRFLEGLLFGVSSVDALTFAAMAGTLVLVTLAACYVPARRAARVDPLIALRYE